MIRGKGSVKEGKVTAGPMPGEDEPLHAYVEVTVTVTVTVIVI